MERVEAGALRTKSWGGFSPVARAVIVAAAVAIVAMFLRVASSVFAPLLLAAFVAILSAPVLRWLKRRGVPKWLALGLVLFVLLDIGSLFALIATGTVESFQDRLPTYQERIAALNQKIGAWLENVGVENSTEAMPDLLDPSKLTPLVTSLLAGLGNLFTLGLLVLLAVAFMLIEAPGLPTKLTAAFGVTDGAGQRLRDLVSSVKKYMLIKVFGSAGTALCVFVLLKAVGIDFAGLWALLAFLFNFVPFVGPILMMIPPVIVALIQVGPGTAALVALGFVTVNTVIGNYLEPRIMGKGFGISTVAVLLGLLFWGWALGPIGVFLSTPLTMAVIIALDASPSTRPLAVLLGPETVGDRATETGEGRPDQGEASEATPDEEEPPSKPSSD